MKRLCLMIACGVVACVLMGCGGSSDDQAAAALAIIVDGDTSDWISGLYKPVFGDAEGDAAGVGPGGDIVAVYVASDGENVYVRIDVANGPPTAALRMGVGFPPTRHEGLAVGDKYLHIEFGPPSCSAWVQEASDSRELGVGEIAVKGNVIEMSVRRRDLEPSSPSYVEAWAYPEGNDSVFDNAGSAAVSF